MKKLLLTASILTAISGAAFAEEELIDPSDLTRVYTQGAVFVTSDAEVRLSTMMTGAWSEDIQFAGFAEANFGHDEKDDFGTSYQNARAQYFQVHALDNGVMPRAGFMVDAIHDRNPVGSDMSLLSAGAIGLINPAYTGGIMVFPNVNYTVGEMFDESVDGYMLNVFTTIPMGDSGAFVQAWPEYMNVSGDTVEMESTQFNVMLNAPVSSNRTQWLMTKLAYGSTEVKLNDAVIAEGNNELKAEIGMKWFF
ncbi:hypothetical protein [uncultured Vibrio sp.]|uniref:hypothetical protein n=1 Tax=uncultured Vibrio sp. TaxID=114054 RepID=UPI0009127C41|nr:hypothetical protein [uncultured Vibrio sp.]OIQ26767.1 MAG: hypothetical protein BM561_01195 [Vibrio sp. MedPE-SWchi]